MFKYIKDALNECEKIVFCYVINLSKSQKRLYFKTLDTMKSGDFLELPLRKCFNCFKVFSCAFKIENNPFSRMNVARHVNVLAYIILELIVWCGTPDSYKLCVINGISL
jgi:hypothetical protein